jgi:hypothetical protein
MSEFPTMTMIFRKLQIKNKIPIADAQNTAKTPFLPLNFPKKAILTAYIIFLIMPSANKHFRRGFCPSYWK